MNPHTVRPRAPCIAVILTVVLALPACSHRQLHEAGRASMESRCMQLGNRDERARCEAAAGEGYEAWSREYEASRATGD